MSRLDTGFELPSGGLITPQGRGIYLQLFTAAPPSKRETNPKRFQWGLTVLFPKTANLDLLKAKIDAVAGANIPPAQVGKLQWKHPLLPTTDIQSLAGYAEDYPFAIRPNAKAYTRAGAARQRPGLIDAAKQEVTEDMEADECYSGRWLRVSLEPYWYPANDGKPGVSLGLVNVQLLAHGDPMAGARPEASDQFDAVGDDALDDMMG